MSVYAINSTAGMGRQGFIDIKRNVAKIIFLGTLTAGSLKLKLPMAN